MRDYGFRFDATYLNLPDCLYTRMDPLPVSAPELVVFNQALADQMGLDFTGITTQEQSALFSGNRPIKSAAYFAQAYAGHQFGHFTTLGDGRALLWGEHLLPDNRTVDIQFKGSGRTPYSRGGDGRAALGPMLHEYVISEAMHHLGIPTTRSLAVVKTGEPVLRETVLPGAILTRVASSHIRVGTFEYAEYRKDKASLQALLEYTLTRHYPELLARESRAIALLDAVMTRQIDLIVNWMRVGFIHGVMNTDNMTLSGETIDYGPCAFMDVYDPDTVFSSIDHRGRYAYANQPHMAQWNLACLAEALLPLIDDDPQKAIKMAEELINTFPDRYQRQWLAIMQRKLGLFGQDKNDEKLISDLLDWMHKQSADFTNTFRDLSDAVIPSGDAYQHPQFQSWAKRWQARLEQNSQPLEQACTLMKSVNPAVIPRNHKVEQALALANEGALSEFNTLVEALKTPYVDSEHLKPYQLPPLPSERVFQTFCGT